MGNTCCTKSLPEEVAVEVAAEPTVPDLPKVSFAIMGVRGLRDTEWFPGSGKSKCFCIVKAAGKEAVLHKTKGIDDVFEPAWLEEVDIYDEYAEGDSLEFHVMDAEEEDGPGILLGKAVLESSAFEQAGFNGELQLEETGKGIQACLRVKVKPAGQEFPPGPAAEFAFRLSRDLKKPLGIEVDTLDGIYAFVTSVNAGPFKTYNDNAKPTEQLMPGDFIIRVNRAEGTASLLVDEMKKNAVVEVVVRRPEQQRVAIDKRNAKKMPLGLEFPKKTAGNSLLVAKVTGGAVGQWNTAHAGQEVKLGDRIVAVDSYRGTAANLLKKAKSANKLHMTFVRPANPETTWWFM